MQNEEKRQTPERFARFVDEYMLEADGSSLKTYLLLLRLEGQERDWSLSEFAGRLDLTENRLRRALSYWSNRGLLQLRYLGEEGRFSYCLLEETTAERKEQEAPTACAVQSAREMTDQEPEPDPVEKRILRRKITQEEGFQDLVHEFSVYMEQGLTSLQFEQLIYLYGELGMSYEVLHYLLELCVEKSHRAGRKYLEGFRYFETVALSWHKKGIRTLAQAREESSLPVQEYFQIMREYGIPTGNRTVNSYQKAFMDRWLYEYGFAMPMIREAIHRTFRQTRSQDANYEYTDRILSGWHSAGARTLEDIKRLDEAYRVREESPEKEGEGGAAEKRERANRPRSAAERSSSGNRFHNFEERPYDYDNLMQMLRQ